MLGLDKSKTAIRKGVLRMIKSHKLESESQVTIQKYAFTTREYLAYFSFNQNACLFYWNCSRCLLVVSHLQGHVCSSVRALSNTL